jgi:hypothetical protein
VYMHSCVMWHSWVGLVISAAENGGNMLREVELLVVHCHVAQGLRLTGTAHSGNWGPGKRSWVQTQWTVDETHAGPSACL